MCTHISIYQHTYVYNYINICVYIYSHINIIREIENKNEANNSLR